jgi:hypothetical protein
MSHTTAAAKAALSRQDVAAYVKASLLGNHSDRLGQGVSHLKRKQLETHNMCVLR